ncbi:lipoprotein [Fictibacillus macauensis ZFHKF-1]|uniref:Lipoprotein n=1 Tax=Fictibacillus macauensis ZFHKF-1 TaxID=1196324 RepID=I8AJN2_9BACL|nr:hypothetical protein [Fictibacillus macauensis]EIT85977.1 lipoprotein [Fictibacillus macauensis ZFHKF-1]
MKKGLLYSLIMFGVFVLTACSTHSTASQNDKQETAQDTAQEKKIQQKKEMKQAISSYSGTKLQMIATAEQTILQQYRGLEDTSDEHKKNTLYKQIIPKYTSLKKKAANMAPQPKELKTVHRTFITGMTFQEQALQTVLDSLRSRDHTKSLEANQLFKKAATSFRTYHKELVALGKKYDLKITFSK